jgi:hypothetical protein
LTTSSNVNLNFSDYSSVSSREIYFEGKIGDYDKNPKILRPKLIFRDVFPSMHLSKSHIFFKNIEIYLEGSNMMVKDIFYFFSLEGNNEFSKSIVFNNTLLNLKDTSGKIYTNPKSYFFIINSLSWNMVLENFTLNLENKCLLSYFIFVADNLEPATRMNLTLRNSIFSSKINTFISIVLKKSYLTATFCEFSNFASFGIQGEDSSLSFFRTSFFQIIFTGDLKVSSSFLSLQASLLNMTRSIIKGITATNVVNFLYDLFYFVKIIKNCGILVLDTNIENIYLGYVKKKKNYQFYLNIFKIDFLL